MSSHIFVDETKRRGYLLVAGVVVPGDLDPVRRTLRGLVLPGQRRPHMTGLTKIMGTWLGAGPELSGFAVVGCPGSWR